jgi:hypothetical protein
VPRLGARRLDAITTKEVQRVKQALQHRAPKTVNNVFTTLNVLLKKAREWGVLDQPPCTIRLLPIPKPSMGFYDFHELEGPSHRAQRRPVAVRAVDRPPHAGASGGPAFTEHACSASRTGLRCPPIA